MIFLNQLRLKIGVTYGNPKPPPVVTPKFYASVRLDIRRMQTLKRATEEYGIRAKVKVAKNKVAPPSASRIRHPVRPRHQHLGMPVGSRRGNRCGGP